MAQPATSRADMQPGTLTSHLARLERALFANNNDHGRAARLTNAELASFGFDLDHQLDASSCERCAKHWSRCTCGSP